MAHDPSANTISGSVRVEWTPFGAPALEGVSRLIATAQAHDALAPITIVTPSPSVAVATRRALARTRPVVGVSFMSIGSLAEMIAAPALAAEGIDIGVDRELMVAAVRSALRGDPGGLAPISHHRSTWEVMGATILELDAVDDDRLDVVSAAGGIPAEVVRIRRLVRGRVGGTGADAVAALATEMVIDGRARLDDVGPVVVHLPEALRPTERRLLVALSARTPVTVVAGATGHADIDADLAGRLAEFRPPPPPRVTPPAVTVAVSANDIDDEVRAAVRRLAALVDDGTPLDELALVHPSGAPYARVVHDVMSTSGLPFAGPSTMSLAQSAVGRLVLRLLEVVRSDHGRQQVIDLWSTGIVVDGDGASVPFAAMDERTRRLGIFDGADSWLAVLDDDDEWGARQLETETDERHIRRIVHRLDVNETVRANLLRLRELTAAAPQTWHDVAPWLERVIDVLCGSRLHRSWPDAALDAETAMVTNLGRLASLDGVEPDPDQAVIFDTIATALERPAPRDGRVGTGILVTTFDQPPVVPLDTVAVVGLVEGHAPRSSSDDVLLGDQLRRDLGLESRQDRRQRERRGFAATLASATNAIITTARHDQRSGRGLVPSRWFIDSVEASTGERPDVEALMKGYAVAGVEVVHSYSAGLTGLGGATAPLNDAERTFAALVASGGVDGSAAADDELLARTELVRSRAARAFTRFDGNLGGDGPEVTRADSDDNAVLSPTSLETYASCPRRWFFANALKLSTIDRPEAVEAIKASDRGTLVHLVLERFFDEMISSDSVPDVGQPWPAAAVARADEICAEECANLERRGLTGHPRRWEHDRDEIHKVVRHALARDVAVRSEFGAQPTAVEFTFGRGGEPPLVVDLGDGRSLALAGQADRVDVGEGRVVVWDYKYAKPGPFEVLVKDPDRGGDPLGFGRKLQLVAYGLAAADRYEVEEVHAWYWFLSRTSLHDKLGYAVTVDLRDRFRTALRVLADGIGTGRFPARPGEAQWHLGSFEACAWCDFDDICPADRDEEWERVRFDPTLRAYRTLVEDGSAALVAEEAER